MTHIFQLQNLQYNIFCFLDDDSMIHTCRCGGKFELDKDEFDELGNMTVEQSTSDIQLNCVLKNENCDCHEILEVECDTCSLVIGVKIANRA